MSFFYVKSSFGTRTSGGGLTQQTGSFASVGAASVYADIGDVWADASPPVAGDVICVSTSHAETSGSNITFEGVNGLTSDGILYISVDDSNCDQYQKATTAQFTTTGSSADVALGTADDRIAIYGLYLVAVDEIAVAGGNSKVFAKECTFQTAGSLDVCFRLNADGQFAELIDCELKANGSNATVPIQVTNGGWIRMLGGSVTSDQSTIDRIIYSGSGNGGCTIELIGVDLSICNAAGDYLVSDMGNAAGEDMINISFHRCRLGASLAGFTEELLYGANKRIEAYNCSSASSAAEYQFYINSDQHVAEDDTSTYRNESAAFTDGGQRASIKVTTAAHCSLANPFKIQLPTRWAALSNASTDTLRFFITSDDSLDDAEVWIEVVAPDGTNKHIPNFYSSQNTDFFAAGTALTTDSTSTYTGGKTNKYQVDVATSGDVAADCVPIAYLVVAKASSTLFIDSECDLVA